MLLLLLPCRGDMKLLLLLMGMTAPLSVAAVAAVRSCSVYACACGVSLNAGYNMIRALPFGPRWDDASGSCNPWLERIDAMSSAIVTVTVPRHFSVISF